MIHAAADRDARSDGVSQRPSGCRSTTPRGHEPASASAAGDDCAARCRRPRAHRRDIRVGDLVRLALHGGEQLVAGALVRDSPLGQPRVERRLQRRDFRPASPPTRACPAAASPRRAVNTCCADARLSATDCAHLIADAKTEARRTPRRARSRRSGTTITSARRQQARAPSWRRLQHRQGEVDLRRAPGSNRAPDRAARRCARATRRSGVLARRARRRSRTCRRPPGS